ASGDFNDDGHPDIAVTNSSGVSVLLNNGNGTLHAAKKYSTGASPSFVAVDDLDHDGAQDLVGTKAASKSVSMLVGNRDGRFKTAETYPVGAGPAAVAFVKANPEGDLDLVAVNRDSNSISVLLVNAPVVLLSSTSIGFGNQNVGTTSSAQN